MVDPKRLNAFSGEGLTRRRMIVGSAVGLCGMAVAGAHGEILQAAADAGGSKTILGTKAIHQEIEFKASPHRIYEALLDAKQFTEFSGGRKAVIQREVGGAFSVFAGHIIGRILELAPDRRIVQAWRVVTWPEGIHSIASFDISAHGAGARVVFDHTGFPSELAEHLESGWNENYWAPLQKNLGK